jgi:aminoglycoside phosphotransferase (APT) family kinase protein
MSHFKNHVVAVDAGMNVVDAYSSPARMPIDLERLAKWLDGQAIGDGPIVGAELLAGGTQNILLRFRRGAHCFVLRSPPTSPRSQSRDILRREGRLLSALARTDVPHPRLIAQCHDPDIIGAVFILMEAVEGFNPTVGLPKSVRADPQIRHRMGLELIEGLAALASVAADTVGLSDFGRMEGFLERQAGRWRDELASYGRYSRWSGATDLGVLDGIYEWLETHRPRNAQAGIIHGDYHIGNMLYSEDGALSAIVDWEMATLGDPLMDLGRLLATWPSDDVSALVVMRVELLTGFPTREELIAHYQRVTGRDLSDLRWFEILGCYKLGILLEGTYARAQAGQAEISTGIRLHATAKGLLERARHRLEQY